MKRALSIVLFLLCLSSPLHAFSDGLKKYFTHLHSKILLKGQKWTPAEMKQAWDQFDSEIQVLLGNWEDKEKSSANYLITQGAWTKIQITDHEDVIDLGAIEMKFYPLETATGAAWLISLYNGMGTIPSSTFRLYKFKQVTEKSGAFIKSALFEEIQGPWDKEQLLGSTIQIQIMRKGPLAEFTTYHMPPSHHGQAEKNNRSQIIWKYDGEKLTPTLWIPSVDWHLDKKGSVVPGRGEMIQIR